MSLRPTTDDVLESILWTFEQHIAPTIDDEFALSAARTITNLLRHVRVRIRTEGQALVDDNDDLRRLLVELGECGELETVGVVLDEIAQHTPVSPPLWPSIDALTAEAEGLRATLDAVVRSGVLDHDSAHAERVDAYLSRQLGREARWADDPFGGERR